MKELTDEEIEKYALNEANALNWADFHDGINYKHGIIKGAKFARDHSPKFKTLEDLSWHIIYGADGTEGRSVRVVFGYYTVYPDRWFYSEEMGTKPCSSIDNGKQLAQSDYENKLKALLK